MAGSARTASNPRAGRRARITLLIMGHLREGLAEGISAMLSIK
jgi:hypothetical protein